MRTGVIEPSRVAPGRDDTGGRKRYNGAQRTPLHARPASPVLAPQGDVGNDARRMGKPVRRLRPLLPEQADRRGHQRDGVYRRQLQAARLHKLPLQRLCPPPGQGEGLRAAHPAQCAAAQMAAADLRLSPGGGGQGSRLVAPACVG